MKLIPALVLAAVMMVLPRAAHAQTTLTACYVPKSGTVYRIKVEGAPSKCSQNHVEFTWSTATSGVPQVDHVTHTQLFAVPAGETVVVKKSCSNDPDFLLTGGYEKVAPVTQALEIVSSGPDGGMDTWRVVVTNHGASEASIGLFVRCFRLYPPATP